jgi:hypothetical protein
MQRKQVVFVVAVAFVAGLSHAVEKGKQVPSARPGGAQTAPAAPGLPDNAPVAEPTFFRVSGPVTTSSTTLDLSWMDNSTNENGFKIARRKGNEGYPQTPIAHLGPNTTKYHDTGLEPETTYWYILAGFRGAIYTHGVEASGTTNPLAPANLTAQALSPKKVQLSWQNRSKVANLIMIERREGNGGTFQKIFQTEPINIATYADQGLKPGTTYGYRLVVLKLPFNASDYTPAVSVVTPAS